jgi:beta-galactosidase
MVEAFDCWRLGKKGTPGVPESDPAHRYFDYARVWDDWFEKDLRAMVRRDRNHPCVAVWSIGNEVREQWSPDGWRLAVALAGIVREEDRTRPVTSGFNNAESGFNGFERAVDWVGFNYKPAHYEIFHRCRPTVPVYGAETASTVSSRGVYVFPVRPGDKAHGLADFQISSYDWTAPEWAWPPDVEWRALDATPTLGEFVWTGFDYLGEPTPYNADETNLLNFADSEARARAAEALARLGRVPVPSRSSYFGIVDLAGFPKDRFFLYRSRWRPELPAAHIVPHWNWPERLGLVTPVQVYASGDEAELFLDGRSLGRRRRGPGEYRFFWDDVVYQPGELRVVVWKGGAPWAEASVRTTGPATALAVSAERATAKADGRGLAFVRVAVTDAEGRVVPRANPFVRFTVDGPGALVATDNGDPTDHEVFSSPRRRAFNGLALAIVRTRRGEPGTIVVRARSDGLAPGEAVVVSAREGT